MHGIRRRLQRRCARRNFTPFVINEVVDKLRARARASKTCQRARIDRAQGCRASAQSHAVARRRYSRRRGHGGRVHLLLQQINPRRKMSLGLRNMKQRSRRRAVSKRPRRRRTSKKSRRRAGKMPERNSKYFRSTRSGAGMTAAGVKRYRELNPGSKLKTAVTGKVAPGSADAKRRKSYCARSAGQARKFPRAAKDPNSRLNQARRRWRC